ncbi:MAG: hypothetical protein KUG56_09180 [Kordiimonadaceae bacterium]|nr:hypothetical protein [Kordiimonadaceae bacterium]
MTGNETKKRLATIGTFFLLAASAGWAWLTYETGGDSQKRRVGDAVFYVPQKYIGPKPDTVEEMLGTYVANFAETHRFETRAVELMPSLRGQPSRLRHSAVIWTLSSLPKQPNATHPTPTITILPDKDHALLAGTPPYAGRIATKMGNGLTKLVRSAAGKRSFAVTNWQPAPNGVAKSPIQKDPALWLAHCIEFRVIRENTGWGRCSRTVHLKDVKLTFHFDGMLLPETAALTTALQSTVAGWRPE